MMPDDSESCRKKVDDIFIELVGAEKARWLRADVPSRTVLLIANAVSSESGYPEKAGWDIGINVSDWQADAAFLVALHLFPERFTPQEIDDGVRSLLIHAPAHVIAAARLAGHSTEDIFLETDNET